MLKRYMCFILLIVLSVSGCSSQIQSFRMERTNELSYYLEEISAINNLKLEEFSSHHLLDGTFYFENILKIGDNLHRTQSLYSYDFQNNLIEKESAFPSEQRVMDWVKIDDGILYSTLSIENTKYRVADIHAKVIFKTKAKEKVLMDEFIDSFYQAAFFEKSNHSIYFMMPHLRSDKDRENRMTLYKYRDGRLRKVFSTKAGESQAYSGLYQNQNNAFGFFTYDEQGSLILYQIHKQNDRVNRYVIGKKLEFIGYQDHYAILNKNQKMYIYDSNEKRLMKVKGQPSGMFFDYLSLNKEIAICNFQKSEDLTYETYLMKIDEKKGIIQYQKLKLPIRKTDFPHYQTDGKNTLLVTDEFIDQKNRTIYYKLEEMK